MHILWHEEFDGVLAISWPPRKFNELTERNKSTSLIK